MVPQRVPDQQGPISNRGKETTTTEVPQSGFVDTFRVEHVTLAFIKLLKRDAINLTYRDVYCWVMSSFVSYSCLVLNYTRFISNIPDCAMFKWNYNDISRGEKSPKPLSSGNQLIVMSQRAPTLLLQTRPSQTSSFCLLPNTWKVQQRSRFEVGRL